MSSEALDKPQLDPATSRRNYRLGIINGILFSLADSLNNANLVLVLLVRQLGGSLTLVALFPTLQIGGYLLPQLLAGGRIQAAPTKLPIYKQAATVRMLAYIALAVVIFLSGMLPSALALTLIISCFMVFTFGGGVSALAFQDVVAKIVPPRQRGRFFGTRQLVGGILAFAIAGPLVRWLLAEQGPLPFPFNFGTLCVLSLIVWVVCLVSFAFVTEPEVPPGPRLNVLEGLRRAPRILREHHNYRWFIISRVLTQIGQIAEPFYIIYAVEQLGLPASVAGVYLAVRAIAAAFSNMFWGRFSDKRGPRDLVRLTSALMMIPPLCVLVGPMLVGALGLGATGYTVAIGLVFLLGGIAFDGSMMAGILYLMEVPPQNERPTYTGLANTILGTVSFVPIVGGALVGIIGYEALFVIACLFSGLGVLAGLRLAEKGRPVEHLQPNALASTEQPHDG